MNYYILYSCQENELEQCSKWINIIWISVFIISMLIFYYIKVPMIAVLKSNFFVLLGIILTLIILKNKIQWSVMYKWNSRNIILKNSI